jgi:hypothetical protein
LEKKVRRKVSAGHPEFGSYQFRATKICQDVMLSVAKHPRGLSRVTPLDAFEQNLSTPRQPHAMMG